MASLTVSTPPTESTVKVVVSIPFWLNLWNKLTEPTSSLTSPIDRRQARLLAALLITFGVISIICVTLLPIAIPEYPANNIGTIFALVMLVVPYYFSRTVHFRIGSVLVLMLVGVGVLYPGMNGLDGSDRIISLQFLVVVIILTSLLMDKRSVIFITGVLVTGMVGIYLFDPNPQMRAVSAVIILILVTCVLMVTFMNNRDGIERDRQKELETALILAEGSIQSELETNLELEARNQELARANAMIKETTRLKSEFLSTMSHELRTPLNAIRGFTGILLEGMGGEIDEEARHMLTRVDANSERLLGLINDVLDIAKIESGRMELTYEPLNPIDLAMQWEAQTSVLAEKKGIGFEVNIDPMLPPVVMGDGQRITQIATNLLSNAFKFTKEGKVTLNVLSEGDNWIISVKDTGIGIPPHALNYIFEEFRQVDGSSKREFGGTGLGLAITRTICRTMGGNVSVRSELGVGSEFTAVLPLDPKARTNGASAEAALA
jgi:signal transduction histidine kinase